jgi:probable HAF family extracellular repeat protein
MRSAANRFVLAITVSAGLLIPLGLLAQALDPSGDAQDRKPIIITFNAPDAGTVSSPACAPDCGTLAYAVNDRGVIVGWYTDTNIVPHGFLRTSDGQFTSFDAPGAGLGHGLDQGTVATSINDRGAITGQFQDSSYVFHGFVRYPDGAFTTFDAPGAGTGAFQGTLGESINPAGEIVGVYIDGNNAFHGFLRRRDGAITDFDDPDAGTGPNQGTVTGEKSINPNGEIDGWYFDQYDVSHGFVRAADGTFTTIDGPDAQSTTAGGINPAGVITGYYEDASNVLHGFLRARDGTFTTFEAPGAVVGTAAFSLNPEQAITGIYIDGSSVLHGFLRHPQGAFTTFDAPGAGNLAGQGTRPEFINAAGMITGFYFDESGVSHGFLRLPDRR